MAGGCRVKDDVVIFACIIRVGEKVGELVEGGNLHGAGSRQLFLHVGDGGFGQQTAVRRHHRLAVFVGSLNGIEVDDGQTLYILYLSSML